MRTNITRKNDLMVNYEVVNGWTVVEIDGDVDVHTAPVMRDALLGLIEQEHRNFVLDLGFVTFLDSMGLGAVVAIAKRVRENQGSLRIASASGLAQRIFRISGLDKAYDFYASSWEATHHAPPG
ncbi:STAS domain-containing protein [Streptomyces sp. NPDC006990]|uniref:STAS domain-containing protein n=1 Tax=unclassified Streptomyces TaxID=2593676 RepID=UPI003452EB12